MKRLAALLLLLPLLAKAEMDFITLQHRDAETLVPLLQPVLDEGIRISGKGATLIVNSKPWQLEELRALVEQLDTPLQSLMISVIQGSDADDVASHGDLSGTPQQPQLRVYGTKKKEREAVRQQLHVTEGHWAYVRAGESVPVARQTTTQSHHGSATQQSLEYKDVQSGFEVKPLLSGERVTLEVRPFRAKRSKSGAGVIEQQEISSTVSGKLGEWITLGGVNDEQHSSAIGTLYTTGKERRATHNVKLRVERLPN